MENIKTKMSAEDATILMSQTIKDYLERKINARKATTVTRMALALSKTIETSDLNDRVEFLEHVLKKKK
jgi:hypothetical protein